MSTMTNNKPDLRLRGAFILDNVPISKQCSKKICGEPSNRAKTFTVSEPLWNNNRTGSHSDAVPGGGGARGAIN